MNFNRRLQIDWYEITEEESEELLEQIFQSTRNWAIETMVLDLSPVSSDSLSSPSSERPDSPDIGFDSQSSNALPNLDVVPQQLVPLTRINPDLALQTANR